MGLEKADKGEFEVGETVKVAYVDQQHKDIDPNKSVYQVISGGNDLIRMGGRDINARAYLSRFNFSGADQEKLCGVLSGGERTTVGSLTVSVRISSLSKETPMCSSLKVLIQNMRKINRNVLGKKNPPVYVIESS